MNKATQKLRWMCMTVLFFVSGLSSLCAQVQEGRVHFELLTCSSGREVYELYGHTALRVSDGRSLDVVFNYGVFDFNQPHFLWNFILGRTDYIVQPIPFSVFIREYDRRGSSVTSQRLNLLPEESVRLFRALQENCLSQNRVYRYNFLYSNCTTKVRDIVERALGGEVRYPDREKVTARQCLHHFTQGHAWAEVGDDMLLGANVDTILSARNSTFLPERLMNAYAGAVVFDEEGNQRPLLLGPSVTLIEKREVPEQTEFPLSPLAVVCIFAALCLLVWGCEFGLKRMLWGFDLVVMLVWGVSGLLLTFFFLFSEHPTVDSNWQVLLFNPLPLCCMPWVIRKALKHEVCYYHLICLVWLVLFLVFTPWVPQQFAQITVPLALCLLTRPLSYLAYYRRTEHPQPINRKK